MAMLAWRGSSLVGGKGRWTPRGDCDNLVFGLQVRKPRPPWKRSMDPEGDCDIFIVYSSMSTSQKVEKVDGP